MPPQRPKHPALGRKFNPMKYLVLLAVIIIPSIYAGILTWANYDPTGTIDAVPAAIVNADQPATTNTGNQLALGDDLTQELLTNNSTRNFKWSVMDADQARTALENGRVQAVLTIPADFSTNVASLSENSADNARTAKLDIATNDGSNIVSGNIASSLGTAVTDALAHKVSTQYLGKIYAGFTNIHGSLEQASEGAQKLADGSTSASQGSKELVVGLTDLKSGTGSLSNGASSLADGTNQISSGASSLATGATSLADGTSQVNNGAASVATGASNLAGGTSQVKTGADSLAAGATQVNGGASSLATGAAQVNGGASSLATGADQVNSGASSLSAGLDQLNSSASSLPEKLPALTSATGSLKTGTADLAAGAESLKEATGQVSSGATALSGGADAALAGAQTLATGATDLHAATSTLATGASDLAAGTQSLIDHWDNLTNEQKLAALQQLNTGANTLSAGATAASTGASTLAQGAQALVGDNNNGLTKLANGANTLETGAAQTASGASTLATGANTLSAGATELDSSIGALTQNLSTLVGAVSQAQEGASALTEGTSSLASGARTLTEGTSSLATGANTLAEGTNSLDSGASALAAGAGSLDSGATQLKDGANTLAEGTNSLNSGATQLKDGANTLAEGTNSLNSGATQLKDGAAQLDAGTGNAVDGATRLSNGLNDLDKGTSTLSTALSNAFGKVPSYTEEQASNLSAVTSNPVTIDKTRLNEVSTYGHGLAPYFMTLGLWVGAIAYFMMYPAISSKFARRTHSGLATLRGALAPVLVMGTIQGAVMTVIIHNLVDIHTVNFWGLMGFAVLTSLTFLAINQALIALLDAPGRFIALLLTVIQIGAAGGTYPIETAPHFLQVLHPWLPLTHALEAFRSLIAGGSIGITAGIIWLLGWIALAVAGTAVSIWIRHRREDRRTTQRTRKNTSLPEPTGATS